MTQNGNQRSLGRFLVCLFIWFVILTQCGTYWIYEGIDRIVNRKNKEVDQQPTNTIQPSNPTGKFLYKESGKL